MHDGEIQRARAAGGEPGDAPAELLCADSEFGDQARHDVFRQVVGGIAAWTVHAFRVDTERATGIDEDCDWMLWLACWLSRPETPSDDTVRMSMLPVTAIPC